MMYIEDIKKANITHEELGAMLLGIDEVIAKRAQELQRRRDEAIRIAREFAPKAQELVPDSEIWVYGATFEGLPTHEDEVRVAILLHEWPEDVDLKSWPLKNWLAGEDDATKDIWGKLWNAVASIETPLTLLPNILKWDSLSSYVTDGGLRVAKAETWSSNEPDDAA